MAACAAAQAQHTSNQHSNHTSSSEKLFNTNLPTYKNNKFSNIHSIAQIHKRRLSQVSVQPVSQTIESSMYRGKKKICQHYSLLHELFIVHNDIDGHRQKY